MFLLLFSMIITSILEALGVSLVVLFISIINDPGQLASKVFLRRYYEFINPASMNNFLIFNGIILIIFYIFKNLFISFQTYIQFSFTYYQQAKISGKLLYSYLHNPYEFHLQRNSSELLRNITGSTDALFGNGVNPLISIISELLVVFSITILLFLSEPLITASTIFIVGGFIALFYKQIRHKISYYGNKVQDLSTKIILWTNQSLGGVKEIKILRREPFFIKVFSKYRFDYAKSLIFVSTMQKIPRLYLEVMMIGGILLIITILLAKGSDIKNIIPIAGLFVMASFRIMPSISQIVSSLNSLRFGHAAVDDVYIDLKYFEKQEIKTKNIYKKEIIPFSKEIRIKNLTYAYPGTNTPALNEINLCIENGTSVAFVGPSGAGKSTLIDIMLGLLTPQNGNVFIDGKDIFEDIDILYKWQGCIGYVPQQIYLIDDTISHNIALGVDKNEIDNKRIEEVIKRAEIADFISNLQDGINTIIGERGVRLSGGQRQRIGIARALYHDPKVLVMDEATSSLDNETESEISKAINDLKDGKTMIIIAHRLSTVKKCDRLFFMQEGRLIDSGSIEELYYRNSDFRRIAEFSNLNISIS